MYVCRVTDVYGGSQTVIDDVDDALRREQLISVAVKRRFERDHDGDNDDDDSHDDDDDDDSHDDDDNDDYILFSIY